MYKLQPNGGVMRVSDGYFIPSDEANMDWQAYLEWLGQGNTPEPYRSLAERRDSIWLAIKSERDRRKAAGAKAGDYWFHSDADSRIQQLGLYTKATNGSGVPSTQWKTMSGAARPMTNQLAIDIFNAVEALDLALFARAETLRAQVNASSDPESIDILAGWPQSYEESLL